MMNEPKILIGFIGQGWIGKHYSDNFEERGFEVVRYSLEEPWVKNKDLIKKCDLTFIAVPTPTTPKGFSSAVVEEALGLVGDGKTAIIKSTIVPGTTEELQDKFKNITVLYSPEFLSEATAKRDADHPFSNIVGISKKTDLHESEAKKVLTVLPPSPFSTILSSTEAELLKYSHNVNGYFQIILFNLMYDLSQKLGADWSKVKEAISADPYMLARYAEPLHKSGRGAGGHCFIKDLAALRGLYGKLLPEDEKGRGVFEAMERKNIELLEESGKDLDLLEGVYGDTKEEGEKFLISNFKFSNNESMI